MATIFRAPTVAKNWGRPPPPSSTGTTGPNLPLTNLAGQGQFFGLPGQPPTYDWPAPRPRPAGDRSFLPGSNLNLIAPPVAAPFFQTNWPAPQARPPTLKQEFASFSFVLQQPVQIIPFNVFDWPATRPRPQNAGGFVNPTNINLIGLDQFFSSPGRPPVYEWPPPRYRPQPAGGFLSPLNVNLLGQDRFFGAPGMGPTYDWPPPRYRQVRYDRYTIAVNLLETTLKATSVTPFNFTDWKQPRPRPAPMAYVHYNWTATFGQITRVRVRSFIFN